MTDIAEKVRYDAVPAAMGWAVVMRGPEGSVTVEYGIKRWETAKKRAALWQKREDAAAPSVPRDAE